ncbi:hypothetical protein BJ138DRAFT_21628 [Hygrophoropsis aurantiaca]|uniref:Uncharacterized protein n=1 Tax=Hygrophoropsis aurantiaca TaxID=72124 RepID=A0ACB8AQ88_9AGAM|nr:hypothetical protein BJ138DRAFT_21628 [Hygrophoropsis aurantiaca]
MQITLSAVFASIVAAATASIVPVERSTCAEAARFGVVTFTPTTVAPGDTLTVTADFTCAISYGINPEYTDYYIEVPVNNNGYEPNILLTRRTPSTPTDTFTVQLPYAPYNADASYSLVLETTYPINGTNGPYSVVGGVDNGITITSTA